MELSDPFGGQFADPMMTTVDPRSNFNRVVLEQVKFRLQEYLSASLLDQLRISYETTARAMGDHIAYRVEGVVYGKEARERTVERSTKTEKVTKEEPVIKTVQRWEDVPASWRDDLGAKVLGRLARWSSAADEALEDTIKPLDDVHYKGPLSLRLRRWWRNLVYTFAADRLPSKTRRIDVEVTEVKNVSHHPVTKHIEVHKHWHTCPHLNIKAQGPHFEFLMDAAHIE